MKRAKKKKKTPRRRPKKKTEDNVEKLDSQRCTRNGVHVNLKDEPNHPKREEAKAGKNDEKEMTVHMMEKFRDVLIKSWRNSETQKQMARERQKLLNAGDDGSLDAKKIADYSGFLNNTREKLAKKAKDLQRRQKVAHSLCLKCRDPRMYKKHRKELERVNGYLENLQHDVNVLNQHVSEFKASKIYSQCEEAIEKRCIVVPGYGAFELQTEEELKSQPSFEELLRAEKEASKDQPSFEELLRADKERQRAEAEEKGKSQKSNSSKKAENANEESPFSLHELLFELNRARGSTEAIMVD